MLRSILAWCRKQYLSTIVALAVAFACLFGPLLALPAHAAGGNDAMSNGVLVSKVSEPPQAMDTDEVPIVKQAVSGNQALCAADSHESAAAEGEQMNLAEGTDTSSPNQSMVQSGGAMQQSETEDATQATATPVQQQSNNAGKRAAGVIVATATGGGAFALTKRRIKRDESASDEVEASERIEKKPKVVVPVQTSQSLPLCDPVHLKAREQPKGLVEESELATKYAQINDVGERAFQILIDLGMIELHG